MDKSIIKLYEESFRSNWERKALTDYFSGETKTYAQFASEIAGLHSMFKGLGIRKGDKIALIGQNSSQWVTIYISVLTYGAVIVPILPTFNPADAANIVNHSQSRLLFADPKIWKAISASGVALPGVEKVLSTSDIITVDAAIRPEEVVYDDRAWDDVIIISYTSGTTGFSKGVMLTVGNITANVSFAIDHKFHFTGSRVLGLLPLAHAYGCAFDMLTPLATGSHITLLSKTPTPAILVKAMKDVRPHLICTVPLVLEKIVKKNVFPKLQKQPIRTLLAIPGAKRLIRKKICKSMLDSFGGCCKEVNTGGAALSPDVEQFLMQIKFPFTVGYGMTECAPLVSYEDHRFYKAGSCGTLLPAMEAKVLTAEGGDGEGEICVRGVNVMKGYYRNPEATAEAIDSEGWFHTGDVGVIEKDGTVYLKGRCKSMILTSNGQNIYPEEIEAKLNQLPLVLESLVYEDKGKLIALVVPDMAQADKDGIETSALQSVMDANLKRLNGMVAPYEKVSECRLCEDEFEKTPKRSIRRYLYPKHAKLFRR